MEVATDFPYGHTYGLRHVAGAPVAMSEEDVVTAEALRAEGIAARVLNVAFIEPLDTAAVLSAAAETRGIVVVEEATSTGGLGAAVATLTAQERPARLRLLGVPRAFAPTGSTAFLWEHFGLTAVDIAAAARDIMAHAR